MGTIHIGRSLDPGRTLLRQARFHELVDLLTFNQMPFAHAEGARCRALLDACGWGRESGGAPAGGLADGGTPARRIAFQLWSLDEAPGRQAGVHDPRDPHVCLLTTARCLAQALAAPGEPLHIGTMRHAPGPAKHDGERAIAFFFPAEGQATPKAGGLHRYVDIGRALTGIVLPAGTPPRFRDLVSRVVQERAWVPVTDAGPAAPRSCTRASARAGRLQSPGGSSPRCPRSVRDS